MTSRLDPRVANTRVTVLDATAELLAEQGFERLTIEAIAERSGVARSTIYRNWPDKSELLTDAFDQLCAFAEIPDLESMEDELRFIGQEIATNLQGAAWAKALPSLIGAAHHDETLTRAQQLFSERRREMTGTIFTRAAQRGELTAAKDPGRLAEWFAAGFFFRFLMTRTPIDDDFIEDQVRAVVALARD